MVMSNRTRWRRKKRVRKKIRGSSERPRLSVFRSNAHIYAQLIDDSSGRALAAVSTLSTKYRERLAPSSGRKEKARVVGNMIAELAKQKGIEKAIFDRGYYRYHGRVRALAEGAREGGLKF